MKKQMLELRLMFWLVGNTQYLVLGKFHLPSNSAKLILISNKELVVKALGSHQAQLLFLALKKIQTKSSFNRSP